MKSKLLIAFMLLAGGSAFAQTHFSIRIGAGGYGPGYYAPAPAYVAPARPYYRSYGYSYGSAPRYYGGGGGAGYWGESPERRHERAERQGLRNHHEKELMMYGDSPELRQHQAEERWQLRHEQWHERHGDYSPETARHTVPPVTAISRIEYRSFGWPGPGPAQPPCLDPMKEVIL